MSRSKIYLMRGGGFGFLLAAIVFVFTWNPSALVLVPVGIGVGYLLSQTNRSGIGMAGSKPFSAATRLTSRLVDMITRPNLAVRFFNLWLLGLFLLLVAWTAGYYLMPEAFFRQAAVSQLESRGLGNEVVSVTTEWLRIFRANLIPFVLIILANLVIRFNRIPLGYIPPLYNVTLYGLFLGTNSFAIPYPERLAPTLAILQRAGPYEMTAFIMAAAATATWSYYEVRQLFRTNSERVRGAPRVSWQHVIVLVAAAALLGAAAGVEATMIAALP